MPERWPRSLQDRRSSCTPSTGQSQPSITRAQWQLADPVAGSHPEHLMHLDAVRVEPDRGGGEVQTPDAGTTLADERDGVIPRRLEIRDPTAQGARVVLAQALQVSHLEARILHGRHDSPHLVQLTVGKHVTIDERTRARRSAAVAVPDLVSGTSDRVVEEAATRTEQVVATTEVLADPSQTDVLEHADRRNRVVRTVANVSVVLQPYVDVCGAPGSGHALRRQVVLGLRNRDADRSGAE